MGRTEVPEGNYGTPIKFDPEFNGPVHRRSCTDIICLLVFIAFVVCWGFVCGFAFMSGDVSRLLAPTDSLGQRCGFTEDVKDRPNLVFFDITQCIKPEVALFGCRTTQMCVKECPKTTRLWKSIIDDNSVTEAEFNKMKSELICDSKVDVNAITKAGLEQLITDEKCAKYNFQSKPVSKRCFAANIDEILDQILDPKVKMALSKDQSKGIISDAEQALNSLSKINEMGARIIEDLVNLKWWILLGLVFVMIICMIYIAVLRWIAGPVVWFTLLAILGLLSWSIYLCYVNYKFYNDQVSEPDSILSIGAAFESLLAQKETWMVLLIASCIALLVILLMIIFLRKRIVIAIALIKEGSKAVSSIKSSLFFPIFPWVMEILILALAASACLFLATIGDDTFQVKKGEGNPDSCTVQHKSLCYPNNFTVGTCTNVSCVYTGVMNYPYIPWMQAWNVVAFIWVLFFIQGVGDMILAGAFATWYWTFHKSDVPYFSLTYSVGRTLFFNLGTVAFGSLIITICRLIRIAIEYVDQQCKKYDNFITKCLICCCRCFFACLESFLRFINKNAFIMCAVHGKGFCSSARKAFNLLMRNILRVVVLDKVTDFLFFLSKLVVAIACGAAAYFVFREPVIVKTIDLPTVNYDMVPALLIGIIAYFIASVFFGVYSMAVDTLFLCFLEDIERNDGSQERPYFMSKNLMKILGKKNK